MERNGKTIRDARYWLFDTLPMFDTRTPLQRGVDTVRKRVEETTEDIQEQDQSFWIAFSFGVGLAAAGIFTYFWWRRRFQQREDDGLIQLGNEPEDSSGNGAVGGEIFVIDPDISSAPGQNGDVVGEGEQDGGVPSEVVEVIVDQATNVAFFGVVDTRHYYPLETPLDQLTAESGEVVDVVYFVSEDDAQSQGYTLASQE